MSKNNVAIAEAYYTAMGEKNIEGLEKHLHPEVQFYGPLGTVIGKEALLKTVKNFMAAFKTLTIRAKFSSEDQAVVIYDVDFPAPIGHLPGAALLTFQEGLIAKLELFYDGRPMEKKKDEIFSKK